MTLSQKLNIYDTLLTNYSVGDCIPLSAIGTFLRSHNITPSAYGYEKLRELADSLPEVFSLHSVQPRAGVPLVWYATILSRPTIDETQEKEITAASSVAVSESVHCAEAEDSVSEHLPETMESVNIFFPNNVQTILSVYITGKNESHLTPEMLAQVKSDYRSAIENNTFFYDEAHNAYTFHLSAPSSEGIPLIASVCRSDRDTGSPWFIKFIGQDFSASDCRQAPAKPGEALRSFAYLGNMTEFLRELANHAQEELWNFKNNPDDYSILQQYVFYTFYRLQQQNKVCISDDGSFAAFNTGLQSRRLNEDIFAFFTPNEPGQKSPWQFCCFCSTDSRDTNERRCYKTMINAFKEPELATYFEKITDLLFDPACDVHLSSDHIFKDNCDRLPLDFLQKECNWNPQAKQLLLKIRDTTDPVKSEKLFLQLGNIITDDEDLFASMNERIQGALNRAVKRIRRNYKLAVPCFFPTRNVMSLMLPLSFTSTGEPSLVVVCERTLSGDYLGQTILTLPMAYIDARLLCRPGSEWLNTQQIIAAETPDILPLETV
jgi:hypothetical protein